jgi:hypothetical protein
MSRHGSAFTPHVSKLTSGWHQPDGLDGDMVYVERQESPLREQPTLRSCTPQVCRTMIGPLVFPTNQTLHLQLHLR